MKLAHKPPIYPLIYMIALVHHYLEEHV